MNRSQKKVIVIGGSVLAALILLLIVLLISNLHSSVSRNNETAEVRDSLARANEQLRLEKEQMVLEQEFNKLNSDFLMYEDQQRYLENDSLVQKYNEAKQRVESLIKQLDAEKKSNKVNKDRIKELEAEIGTLKGIVRHYLEEIKRLGDENTQLKAELEQKSKENVDLAAKAATTSRENAQLTETVKQAKKLNITGLSLHAYNKNGKTEKNITKAKKLGVSFTVSPNNTTAPGMKDFIVRIVSPEGTVLSGGGMFSYDGASIEASASRQMEYSNDELPVSVYWTANTTLSAGDYLVEVFCDGYRLASRKFPMKK